jgi:hypothetical protein
MAPALTLGPSLKNPCLPLLLSIFGWNWNSSLGTKTLLFLDKPDISMIHFVMIKTIYMEKVLRMFVCEFSSIKGEVT